MTFSVTKILRPKFILENYFWLLTITAILNIVTGIGWLTTLVLPIVIYSLLFLRKRVSLNFNLIDSIWFVLFFWMIGTWFYNDYPHQGILIVRCFAGQIAYMMTYWIARTSTENWVSSIIQNAYVPLVLTCCVGIYCFFFPPHWYKEIIQNSIDRNSLQYVTQSMILEANRLRSIFFSPYTLAYFSSITMIFTFFQINRTGSGSQRFQYGLMALLMVTSLLTMMRGPFVCTLIGGVLSILYSYKYLELSRTIFTIIVFFLIGTIFAPVVLSRMDKATNLYFVSKVSTVTTESDEFVEQRLFLNRRQTEMLGDGVGRHDIQADKYNPGSSMRDGEYMKTIQEQGYIGLGIFFLFCFLCMIKGIRYFRDLTIELCLLIMLLICMIGANPLSTADKHCIIFWMAIGQIARHGGKRVIKIKNY